MQANHEWTHTKTRVYRNAAGNRQEVRYLVDENISPRLENSEFIVVTRKLFEQLLEEVGYTEEGSVS